MTTHDETIDSPDPERRRLIAGATAAAGGLALAGAGAPFLASLGPSERAKALGAPVEVDIEALPPGQLRTLEWRGKPVWILRRTPPMVAGLNALRGVLADPDSEVTSQQPEYTRNPARSVREEYFVSIALCTHLGCIPGFYPEPGSIQADWPGGFYCPCHGSKFDFAGRVYKGSPAPTNLVVPPYRFESDSRIVVGLEPGAAA